MMPWNGPRCQQPWRAGFILEAILSERRVGKQRAHFGEHCGAW